jgi:hypothetical protein
MLDLGFFTRGEGFAKCYGCGWEGIPTLLEGSPSTFCPSCETVPDTVIEEELDAEEARRAMPKVGRNEPCPCGSGKKSKKCCYM